MISGKKIETLRQNKKISQKELAEKLSVSTGTVAEWESGESLPTLEQAIAISTELNVTVNDLVAASEDKSFSEKLSNNNKRNFLKLLLIILIAIAICGIALVFIYVLFFKNSSTKDTESKTAPFSEDIDAIASAEASVVKIYCYDFNGDEVATGSGFVAFEDCYIITNYHVIKNAYAVKISTDQDLTYTVMGIKGYSEKKDIAILQVSQSTDLNPLPFGDSESIRKGETVTAIGSPLGIKNTISQGVLSGRVMNDGYDALQFTASISEGSSGGALFNEKGEVIGITYASYTEGQNLNLAIPIHLVSDCYRLNKLLDATILADHYWENHPREYYEFTYGKPVVVSFEELKRSPSTYNGKMIQVTAYVSSCDNIQNLRMGIYIADKSHISYDENADSISEMNNHYEDHPIIYVSTRKFESHNNSYHAGDQVTIVGAFDYWKSGESRHDVEQNVNGAIITAMRILQ